MTEQKTIWVDSNELMKIAGEPVVTPGASVSTSTSQYDVPEAIRSYLDDQGHCVIRLQYIGPDEPLTTIPSDHMQVQTGKYSGRIYAFLMNAPAGAGEFDLAKLHEAVSVVEKQHLHPRRANYKLVDLLLNRWGEEAREEEVPSIHHAYRATAY